MIATDYPLLNVFWTMLMFFVFVAWIVILVSVFADNFRRPDHSGLAKAGWTVLIIFLPFLGVLLYLIARPKMTAQDQQMLARMGAPPPPPPSGGSSPADELAKLAKLRDDGKITAEEYEKLKARALASL